MRVVFLIALLLSGQAAFAQTARVAGIVVEEGTNNPVPGARVILNRQMVRPPMPGGAPPRPAEATTDEQGRFQFEGLSAGGYSLMVSKPTFAVSISNARTSGISLADGESRDDLRLQLQRGGVIAGKILDADGEPLVEARISALRETENGQMPMLRPSGPGTQTNDLGEFRLYGLSPGDYIVQVTPRMDGGPFANNDTSQKTALGVTYYPAAAETSSAQTVAVRSGQTTRGVNIRMRRISVFTVSGFVVDDTGAPAAGTMVSLMRSGGNMGFMMGPPRGSQTAADGSFVIAGVAPGQYLLSATIRPTFPNAPDGAVGAVSGGFASIGGTMSPGGGITTETRNGVTIQYRTPNNPPVPVSVTDADINGLQVVAQRPQMLP